MMPYARRVSERTGLDPRLVLAQSALETGYGKSAPNSNYFGIKGAGQVFPSEEFFGGKMVVEPSEFRAYENPQQSFDDYASFITGNKRYEPVLKAKTLSDQIAAMGASGYATDPNYGAKLSSIANMIGEDILPKGTSMATPMDRAREEELRLQMLASGTVPQAAPRAPLSALRQDRPQAAAAPQQRRSGFGGIMDYLGTPSPTTGLSRAEQFAAALDPLIMPEMRAGEAIRARGAQRQATATKNKTVEYLRRMGYNDYADAVESGAIGAKDIMNALISKSLETPAKVSGAEDKIRRLMETGLDRTTAIAIADGRLTTSQDPITGQVQLIDKGTGNVIAPSVPQSVAAEVETSDAAPTGQFERLDPTLATGARGWANFYLNKVTDAIGAGQVAGEAGEVAEAMNVLKLETLALADTQFAGKPTNFIRERVEEFLTISPSDIGTGPDAARKKADKVINMLERTLSNADAISKDSTAPAAARQSAQSSLQPVKDLLTEYRSLKNAIDSKLNPASSPAVDPAEINLMNSLLQQNGSQ
jgi:hypothetical protein